MIPASERGEGFPPILILAVAVSVLNVDGIADSQFLGLWSTFCEGVTAQLRCPILAAVAFSSRPKLLFQLDKRSNYF